MDINGIKISDFGMSRVLKLTSVGVTQTHSGPIKWMSPESLRSKEYSMFSDVWSFGVVIYEVITRMTPFPGLPMVQVAEIVKNENKHVELPENSPKFLRDLVEECSKYQPSQRPLFSTISATLQQFYSRC